MSQETDERREKLKGFLQSIVDNSNSIAEIMGSVKKGRRGERLQNVGGNDRICQLDTGFTAFYTDTEGNKYQISVYNHSGIQESKI